MLGQFESLAYLASNKFSIQLGHSYLCILSILDEQSACKHIGEKQRIYWKPAAEMLVAAAIQGIV
jgi:hypothetical protein